MRSIWKETPSIRELNQLTKNTLADFLEMRFIEQGDNYLKMQMPVTTKTQQPYGLLHGGASAALAETVGSVASALCIDKTRQICVGMEINCNHIKAKRSGFVTATATPLHLGASTHVWDVRLTDEKEKLIAVSRLTVAILKKPGKK